MIQDYEGGDGRVENSMDETSSEDSEGSEPVSEADDLRHDEGHAEDGGAADAFLMSGRILRDVSSTAFRREMAMEASCSGVGLSTMFCGRLACYDCKRFLTEDECNSKQVDRVLTTQQCQPLRVCMEGTCKDCHGSISAERNSMEVGLITTALPGADWTEAKVILESGHAESLVRDWRSSK